MGQIRTMHSCAGDARQAAREFHAGVIQPDTELVMFFCSSEYDLAALADEMNVLFQGVRLVGCTTAGEIGPAGYRNHSLSGVAFPAGLCTAVAGGLDHLQQFQIGAGQTFARDLLKQLDSRSVDAEAGRSLGFMMIDGLSVREEVVGRAFQSALGSIPLLGGSAGDDLKLARTWVFYDGAFHADSAVLVLMSTSLPFKLFRTQHFVALDERVVVTEADAEQRVVKEINGLPAAQEYARLVGVEVDQLDAERFATTPVVVLIDGTDYVRSIQQVLPDESLKFYCAIEDGLVLRVARGLDLVHNLEAAFDRLAEELGPPQLVLACDCILRRLEIVRNGQAPAVEAILHGNHVVGFSTYGEQIRGVHVNQTFTGIAFGQPRENGHD